MEFHKLNMSDFEQLNDLAEDVIISLRYTRYQYDNDGNDAISDLMQDEVMKRIQNQMDNIQMDYLNFSENKELKEISFQEAVEMPFNIIKDKYLKDILPMARGIMRKDSRLNHGIVVSDEISDEVLDNFLILRWKENLKLWIMQFEISKKMKK